MAKFISFNGEDYRIEDADLASAITKLKSHLSTVMNGTGATIELDGISYGVDSTKLTNAKNTLTTHLGSIAGDGPSIVVNGVKYTVDSTKIENVVSDLQTVFEGLRFILPPGLYQPGAIERFNSGDGNGALEMLITSWDDMIAKGTMKVKNGTVYLGVEPLADMPEKNEYGFYFDVPYDLQGMDIVFHRDGSGDIIQNGQVESFPAESIVYSELFADALDIIGLDFTFSSDGLTANTDNGEFCLGSAPLLNGDFVFSEDVTSISNEIFANNGVTNIIIPDSVTSIGSSAFYNCSSLASVTIGDSVTSIGKGAFNWCTNLTSVTIPDSVTNIDDYTFSYCSSLTSVTIPDSVTTIGKQAFMDCDRLVSVTIGNGVTSIGREAFAGCDKLVEVTNHSSLNITVGSMDYGFVAYYAIEAHSGESKIVNIDGYLFYTYDGVNYLFGYVGNDTEPTLPKNYNGEDYEIYKYAFRNCSNLTSVTIPDSVISIGEDAFYGCDGLTSVIIGNGVTSIGEEAFRNCSNLKNVTIDNSATSIGSSAFAYCKSLTSATIGNGITSIGEEAFRNCSNLKSITIPDSATSIGSYAFYQCSSLTNVTIGDSVTSIGSSAFSGCSSLTSVTIGNSVTSIDSSAFEDCSSLTSVTIPDSVTTIGREAFYSCDNLTSVTIGDGVTSIGPDAFAWCKNLTSATFENPEGWWYASSSSATEGTSIPSEELADPSTAATYLKTTYKDKYWKRS